MKLENQAQHPHPAEIQPDPSKKPRSEAAGTTNSEGPDPRHPPRRHRGLSLVVVAALLLMGIGQAAWPVIDVSAIAQLIEAVEVATDTLDEMTTAKQALLGEVAKFTGTWDSLTGNAYQLGEKASSLVTEYSLTQIETGLTNRRNALQLAWPTQGDVQNAYAGEEADVIQQVLDAHQAETMRHTAVRNAWYDSQIVIAEAGQFLEAIEATASTQNGETTAGMSAQLDRHIAVSSASRDIAARQLELAVSAEHRAARLEHQQSLLQAQLRQQGLAIRTEIQDSIAAHEADFDAAAFDQSLYTPVIPTN